MSPRGPGDLGKRHAARGMGGRGVKVNGMTRSFRHAARTASVRGLTALFISVETGPMSSVDTGQMSAVATGQMSAAETGQMSAAETRQMSTGKTGRCPVSLFLIYLVSTADICPVATEDIYPVSTEDRTAAGRRPAAVLSSVGTG